MRVLWLAIGLAIVLLQSAAPVRAANVTYDFSGLITVSEADDSGLPDVSPGTTFSGSIALPDLTVSNNLSGIYQFSGPALSSTFADGTDTFEQSGHLDIQTNNSFYSIRSFGSAVIDGVPSDLPITLILMLFSPDDPTETYLLPGSLSAYSGSEVGLINADATGGYEGVLTSFAEVPLPPTLYLLATGLAALVGIGWRFRWRATLSPTEAA